MIHFKPPVCPKCGSDVEGLGADHIEYCAGRVSVKTWREMFAMGAPPVSRQDVVDEAVMRTAVRFSPNTNPAKTVKFWGLYRKQDGTTIPMLSRWVRETINQEFSRIASGAV